MNNKYNRMLKNSLGWLVLWLTCTLCEGKTPINFKAQELWSEGHSLFLQKLYSQSEEKTLAAIEVGGSNLFLYRQCYALLLMEMGRIPEAIQQLQQSLRLNRRQRDSYSLLGGIYSKSKEYQMAYNVYRMALKYNPNEATFHFQLGSNLIYLNRTEDAEAPLRKAFSLAKSQNFFIEESKFLLGFCLRELGQFQEAHQYLEQVMNQDPTETNYIDEYGDLLLLMGKYQECERIFRKAIEIDSSDPELKSDLGLALLAQGREEEAEHYFIISVSSESTLPDQLGVYGHFLAERGRYGEAYEMYERAYKIKPVYIVSSAWYGLIMWHNNKTSQALSCLKLATDPTDPITLFTLASLLGLTNMFQ